MEENREKTEKRDENGLFQEGTAPGPGRPAGQRNYATIYREALIKLAEKNGKSPDELEDEIVANALLSARKGDYRFYKDLLDRLYGKAQDNLDVTTGGEKLQGVVILPSKDDSSLETST